MFAEDITRIAEYLGMSIDDFGLRYLILDDNNRPKIFTRNDGTEYRSIRQLADGGCAFQLYDGKCAVWVVRPRTCAEYQEGGPWCKAVFVNRNDLTVVSDDMPSWIYSAIVEFLEKRTARDRLRSMS